MAPCGAVLRRLAPFCTFSLPFGSSVHPSSLLKPRCPLRDPAYSLFAPFTLPFGSSVHPSSLLKPRCPLRDPADSRSAPLREGVHPYGRASLRESQLLPRFTRASLRLVMLTLRALGRAHTHSAGHSSRGGSTLSGYGNAFLSLTKQSGSVGPRPLLGWRHCAQENTKALPAHRLSPCTSPRSTRKHSSRLCSAQTSEQGPLAVLSLSLSLSRSPHSLPRPRSSCLSVYLSLPAMAAF